MCVIAFAHHASPRYPLVVAANRDESHARATLPADWWADAPADSPILGGRDAVAGGTWLAIGRDLRLAAVTNLRDADGSASGPRSRGLLVSRFLSRPRRGDDFAASLDDDDVNGYAPFNLVLFDGSSFHYVSNRAPSRRLPPGIHALSNALPDAQWPKVARARDGLAAALDEHDPTERLFALLAERGAPADGYDERQVSLFQRDSVWGTRCSTVILADRTGHVSFIERSFDPAGDPVDEIRIDFDADISRAAATAS